MIHIVDDVEHFQCTLDRISAFPYESMLGKMRKIIRTANRPLAQVCRRMHEMDHIKKLNYAQSSLVILKEKKKIIYV